ncbi:MAG: ATP-dependent sacrificial sulfur transferase LarE [Clostridia bacterium]|nr:ATP-dependent sacrificial sulfur transferase LarE [Clostridia bacterium]
MEIQDFFKEHKSVAVAFSGGVDSAVLLMLALRCAERVKAYFVKSPFQPAFELEDAKKTAELLGAPLEVLCADVLSDPTVRSNPKDRCYYCKKRIFGIISEKAHSDGFDTLLDGTNASDDETDRPGVRALRELGVLSPLRECGLDKAYIRKLAAENGLPVFDKPSYACLATRIPYGTPISEEVLLKTENAEGLLMREGFRNFRIRYADGSARLELGKAEFTILQEKREKIYEMLIKSYDNVYLDLKERTDE